MRVSSRGILVAVLALPLAGMAIAQDATYLLKDYMPQAIGSKWIMKTEGRQGETSNTIEICQPQEIQAQQALPFLTRNADGEVIRGSLEAATDNAYYIFGNIRRPGGPRGQGGDQAGDPITTLYDPMLVFPAKMSVGQKVDAATRTVFGDQTVDLTISLELAALETVTVPKGTFENALKLVTATRFGDRGERRSTAWYALAVGLIKTEQLGFGRGDATTRVAELLEYVPAPGPAE